MAEGVVVSDVSLLDGHRVDLRVVGADIAEIASPGELAGENRVACEGCLCVRSLVDAHIHLDKAGTALLGSRVPVSIPEAIAAMRDLKSVVKRDPAALRERMISTLNFLYNQGTVTVRALVDVDESWGLTAFWAACEARRATANKMAVYIEVFPQEGLTPRVADLLREAAASGADSIGAHTDVDEDWIGAIHTAADIARNASLPLEVHVDEAASRDSFKLPKVLELAAGVRTLTLAHCLSLTALDTNEQVLWARRLHDAGAHVVVAPSVLSFGLPLAPVARLLDEDVPILIGSDNLQDVFVPFGTGRMLDLVRTVALSARIIDSSAQARLLSGVSDRAFAFSASQPEKFVPGSEATFTVFSGSNARAILFGKDAVRLSMFKGQITGERKA